jgi:hypothetical protein
MSHAVSGAATSHAANTTTADDVKISDLSNDSLVTRLLFTVNHLSRWITPVHELQRLERSPLRGMPSVKELMLRMRDREQLIFPKLHAMAVTNDPDLDRLPRPVRTPEQVAADQERSVLTTLAEFRRLRQSTCSLLRSLPDNAWSRVGTSRIEHDWQIRSLAEHLANADLDDLREMDEALDRSGVRQGINALARVPLDDLLRLVPVSLKNR